MSTLLQWFTSPEWAQVVKALLHSLWEGASIALLLAIFLRRVHNPAARYYSSLAALTAIVFAALVTWAILNAPSKRPLPSANEPTLVAQPLTSDSSATPALNSRPESVIVAPHNSTRWTAWLAFAWLAGTILMLARAGVKVAGAEKLRRSCRPLDDSRIEALLAETRRALGIANRIRVGITDQLTSPAVVGVVVPMLILPIALLTTLTPEQIRFVLLHELAHIRRRDYLANLFQFLAESLLFFNPAVWWISHQIRREREACCDALTTELSGAPGDYAQTLVHVAEQVLYPTPAAASAFNSKREPSTLTERIQRLLVPGYRPSLQLTWRAMLAALLIGAVLLFSSALGTRITVAAVLENPQRTTQKLDELNFDKVSFPNLPLREVVDTLNEMVRRRDPEHKGIHFILDEAAADKASFKLGDVEIQVDPGVEHVKLKGVLEAIVKSADHPIRFIVEDDGVHFSFPALDASKLSSRTFKIDLNELLAEQDIQPKDFRPDTFLVQRLAENGVIIYPPKALSFDPQQKSFTVRSTSNDLEIISRLSTKSNTTAKLIQDGKLLFEQGKLDEAEAKLDEALQTGNQDALYYLNLISEARAKAKARTRDAGDTNANGAPTPSDATSSESNHEDQIQTAQLVQDGKLMFQLGKMDEAEAKLNEALKRDPYNQAAVYYLSLVKQNRAKMDVDARNLANPAHNLPNPNVYARSNIIHTSPQRQEIYQKLNNIKFDRIAFDNLELSEVVRILTEQTERRDPNQEGINFVISKTKPAANPEKPAFDPTTGQPIPSAAETEEIDLSTVRISLDPGLKNVRLMDVLEAIVKTADHPIKYSLLDYGIEFSLKGPETPELFTRTFRVDPNTFFMGLKNAGFTFPVPRGSKFRPGDPTVDLQAAVLSFFDAAGVKLSPPKAVFFNDRQGTLTVHATADDLNLIEAKIDTLKVAPAEVTIKARFVQLQPGSDWPKSLDWYANTIATNGRAFIMPLTKFQFQSALKELEDRKGADLLNEGEVTTLSGRQAQFQVVEVDTPITDFTNSTSSVRNGSDNASAKFDPKATPFGTTIDVVPYVRADGSTIELTLIPTITARVQNREPVNSTQMIGGSPIAVTLPLPRARVWQLTTNCTVRDGQTLVIGGLTSETDKTTDNTTFYVNTNQLIFITATLIDRAGNRIHSEDYYDTPNFGGGFGGGGFRGGGSF